jgi:hypothetical protein
MELAGERRRVARLEERLRECELEVLGGRHLGGIEKGSPEKGRRRWVIVIDVDNHSLLIDLKFIIFVCLILNILLWI